MDLNRLFIEFGFKMDRKHTYTIQSTLISLLIFRPFMSTSYSWSLPYALLILIECFAKSIEMPNTLIYFNTYIATDPQHCILKMLSVPKSIYRQTENQFGTVFGIQNQ